MLGKCLVLLCPVRLAMILLKDELARQTYLWWTETVLLLHWLFLTSVSTIIKLTSIFLQCFWVVESYTTVCCVIKQHHFWRRNFTRCNIGVVVFLMTMANLLVSLPMKEFWKLVSIYSTSYYNISNMAHSKFIICKDSLKHYFVLCSFQSCN